MSASGDVIEWHRPENLPYILGTGNWEAFHMLGIRMADLLEEAARWGEVLRQIERPWLCWNVDSDWSIIQQRQVLDVGWTPVVGFDPRVGPPDLAPGAVLIDFNARLKLPTMWLHFPMEFAFQYCKRLAFWHADCLVRRDRLKRYAEMFAALPDGEMAAVVPTEGWRALLAPKKKRYWEVIGCTTAGASRSQFEHGSGWWVYFSKHPNAPAAEQALRESYHWECGVGIRYWERKYGGRVHAIPEADIAEGHFTLIGRKDYKRASPPHFKRDLSRELSLNNDLRQACEKLGLTQFLTDPTLV